MPAVGSHPNSVSIAAGVSAASFAEVREQNRGTARSMLGLSNKIDRRHFRVARIISDNQCFGRTRQQIDPHAPKQLALGLGDISVTGPTIMSTGAIVLRAQRHRPTACTPPIA